MYKSAFLHQCFVLTTIKFVHVQQWEQISVKVRVKVQNANGNKYAKRRKHLQSLAKSFCSKVYSILDTMDFTAYTVHILYVLLLTVGGLHVEWQLLEIYQPR